MEIRALQAECHSLQDWKWPEDKANTDAAFRKVVEEIGEIAQALNDRAPKQELGFEIADAILTLLALAARADLDAQQHIEAKWTIVKQRLGYTEAMKQPWDQLSLV